MEQKFPYICIGIQKELRPYRIWAWCLLVVGIMIPFFAFSDYIISHINSMYRFKLVGFLGAGIVLFSWGLICFDFWYSKIKSKKLQILESSELLSNKMFFITTEIFGLTFLLFIVCSGIFAVFSPVFAHLL